MLAPLSWLRDYNEINLPVDQLVKTMILSGTAVEGYEQFGAEIENVVVGKVLKIEKHPDADHLFVCQVDIGEKQLQICTAAKNLYPGALVPVALHGARLAGGIKIKNTKMRGLASEGMFCSYEELGVPHEVYPAAASDGILIFEEDYPLGTDVKTIFNLDDILIDFDILSNRPDCQSIIGVSREIAAALGGTVAEQIPIVNQPAQGDVHQYIQVRVNNQQLCPRFCGKIVKNVKVGPSPLWLRNRLNEVGIRPINNIVDITNYVMVEYGQPMHAYDLTDIRGGQIIVRNAQAGETIRTLDGKDRALEESMLVIADAQGATGVAGIMGGENSEIKETTTTIFLEAACFDFASVRVSAKKLSMRTAASALFEKGVNPITPPLGIARAVELIEQLGAGEAVGGMIDVCAGICPPQTVTAPIDKLYTLMGVECPVDQMLDILNRLNIRAHQEGSNIVAVGPAYRSDIHTPADLAEEILRMVGYDKLPSTKFKSSIHPGAIGDKFEFQYRLRDLFAGAGFLEAMTYSFISPKAYDSIGLDAQDSRRASARILNPLGEDYSIMRTTLIPSMLQTLSTNYTRKIPVCSFFELAPIYLPRQVPITELPDEVPQLALGMYGPQVDFFSIKGVVELLMQQMNIRCTYQRVSQPYLHPGRAAQVLCGDTVIGEFGQVHPDVAKAYKLGTAYVGQIDLRVVKALAKSLDEAQTPPRFPAVTRDIALLMPEDVPVGNCMDTIAKACGKLLDEISVFDVYRGKGVAAGEKSVAYTFSLRAPDRTLTDEEVSKVFDKVLDACQREHGATLRS